MLGVERVSSELTIEYGLAIGIEYTKLPVVVCYAMNTIFIVFTVQG